MSDLNIVGSISVNDIKGKTPDSAEFAKLNPTGKFIEMFYKFITISFNDGSSENILHYYSSFGIWQPSSYNSDNKSLTGGILKINA